MTSHDEQAIDAQAIDAQVDEHLAAALRAARATDTPIDRHAFLARAQVQRDRLHRRRRIWSVATPLVAAALVLVTVALVLQRGDTSQTARHGAASRAKPACPGHPGTPDVVPGDTLFAFPPIHLRLCTYSVDGDLVTSVDVPGPDNPDVAETLDHLQRAYVDTPADPSGPHCGTGEIAIDRIGILAFPDDGSPAEAAWVAMAGCTTPEATPAGAGTFETAGEWADVRLTPVDGAIELRVRPTGASSWGEPRRIDEPDPTSPWTAEGVGLDEVTVHVVVLSDRATITNMGEIAAVTIATPHCGEFTCAVFAVPRGERAGVVANISSGDRTDSVPLGSIAVGSGQLQFSTD